MTPRVRCDRCSTLLHVDDTHLPHERGCVVKERGWGDCVCDVCVCIACCHECADQLREVG